MKDFRGPLPLSDDDFAAIRASVLARIGRRRPYAAILALAASVAVAILSAVVARQPVVVQRMSHHAIVIPSVARDLGARAAHPTPTQVPRYARHDGRHRKAHPVAQVARIEIHTADPNVRIIWIDHQEAP